MKTLKILMLAIPMLALFACDDDEKGQPSKEQIEVEAYVNALKTGQYNTVAMPPAFTAFTHKHIDELLKYRNAADKITKFPRAPFSSFRTDTCILGVCILWTTEYVRRSSIDTDLLLNGTYPSAYPLLRARDTANGGYLIDEASHSVASNAYYNWWTSNKGKPLTEAMNIDPLENTIYKW